MEKRDWENTYSTNGVVQDGVLPTVREAVQIMKERRCKKVLDLCCGTGRHTLFLAKNGFDVSGVDSSKSGIAITGSRAKEIGVDVTLKIADMTCTDFLDNTFDAVICVWSTGHGKKSEYFSRTIREMFRIVAPQGVVMFDMPSVKDRLYGNGECIEKDTFLHNSISHPDVPHYYCTEDELSNEVRLYASNYSISQIEYDDKKYNCKIMAYWVVAEKLR